MNLATNLVIDLLRKDLERDGVPFYLEKKGNRDAGAIFIKHDLMDGYIELYHRVYNNNGEKKFQSLDILKRHKCEEFIKKQIAFDPDVWIIEVEARDFKLDKVFSKLGL